MFYETRNKTQTFKPIIPNGRPPRLSSSVDSISPGEPSSTKKVGQAGRAGRQAGRQAEASKDAGGALSISHLVHSVRLRSITELSKESVLPLSIEASD